MVLTVIGGLVLLIAGHGAGAKLAGLFELVLGPIFVRVYCEVLIVVFKIHASGTQVATEGAEG